VEFHPSPIYKREKRILSVNYSVPTFVKWAGGKTQLLPKIADLLPGKFNRYFEPFLGSGAVFFYLEQKTSCPAFLSDANAELIDTYEVVKRHPRELIRRLGALKARHSKAQFYRLRGKNPKMLDRIDAAARFIYLNKTCYNGLYRVNSKGEFNVPLGSCAEPGIFNERDLLRASRLLQNAELQCVSFEITEKCAKKGDFVYFDPPYHPLNGNGFTGYTRNGFAEEEQTKLKRVFEKLDKRGCKLMLSNSDTAFVRSLYDDFEIRTVKARRAINCKGEKRGEINELIVVNYEMPSYLPLYLADETTEKMSLPAMMESSRPLNIKA